MSRVLLPAPGHAVRPVQSASSSSGRVRPGSFAPLSPAPRGHSLQLLRVAPPPQAPIQLGRLKKQRRFLTAKQHLGRMGRIGRIIKAYRHSFVQAPTTAEAIGEPMQTGLGEEHVHYGINYDSPEGGFGMRNQAMRLKGGTVAEYAFNPSEYPTHTQTPFDTGLASFNQTFNQQISVRPSQANKYTDPGIKTFPTPKGEQSKYFEFRRSKAPTVGREDELGLRAGTRFSKSSIPFSILHGGQPRFHLDKMGGKRNKELARILGKQGKYEDAVTSRELRFVHRFWDERPLKIRDEHGKLRRIRMKDHVRFYKNLRRVEPPFPP